MARSAQKTTAPLSPACIGVFVFAPFGRKKARRYRGFLSLVVYVGATTAVTKSDPAAKGNVTASATTFFAGAASTTVVNVVPHEFVVESLPPPPPQPAKAAAAIEEIMTVKYRAFEGSRP